MFKLLIQPELVNSEDHQNNNIVTCITKLLPVSQYSNIYFCSDTQPYYVAPTTSGNTRPPPSTFLNIMKTKQKKIGKLHFMLNIDNTLAMPKCMLDENKFRTSFETKETKKKCPK